MRSFSNRIVYVGLIGLAVGCAVGSDANAQRDDKTSSDRDDSIVLAAGDDSGLVTSRVFLSTDRLPAGQTVPFAVVLDIDRGWHINANPASPAFLVPTAIAIKSKLGTKLADMKYPKGEPIRVAGIDEPLMTYDGKVILFGKLKIPADAAGKKETIAVGVRYQACDDQECRRPETKSLNGTISVARPGEKVRPINDKLFRPQAARERQSN
ncbi:protein-disulfide reductase DsbD domain-containing protein [Stratiformator vulcanicus]|uniref:Thiol:disulfide interchange protein DsbD N-terminal domain-containing protein n=1 Tax=Stratiformator vulcanicus TaxID=2527980 RepID=A0A517R461_9PLAN|nr:protein-disulfide reductase DsbD domain-containing protein [Stratiformator vulcanicus]QDT38674.1 hypothetical protein Pan189_30700 [Stratiformator vulcanicus]